MEIRQCSISPRRCNYHDRNGAVSVLIADRPRTRRPRQNSKPPATA
jgi:hypothetical protein